VLPTGRLRAMSPDLLLENAGFPLPGELLRLAIGALGRTGEIDLGLGLALALLSAVSGDSIGTWWDAWADSGCSMSTAT